jgi:hypothetical protein
MIKNYFRKIFTLLKGYSKENWGAPFLALFILLLIVMAIVFSLGLVYLADYIAVFGFYVLIIGVVLQIICFIKYRKTKS